MKKIICRISVLLVLLGLIFGLVACTSTDKEGKHALIEEASIPLSPDSLKLIEDKTETMAKLLPSISRRKEDYLDYNTTKTLDLMAVGDIMVHKVQLMAAYEASTDTYNFDEQFKYIKEEFDKADLVFGNFETVTAGVEKRYSGENMIFNAPDHIITAIKNAGVDIVSTTNNHTLDRGYFGLVRTIEKLNEAGIKHVDTKKNEADSSFLIIEENGIKIGILAYAENFNGWTLEKEHEYAANLLILDKAIEDIKTISDHVDIVLVSSHWGHEYFDDPYKTQVRIGRTLIDAGADIVLGHHPHVLQPIEKHGEGYIVYSMGNFISGQRTSPRDHGMIVNINLSKGKYENTMIKEISMLPTYVQSSYQNHKPYMRVLSMDTWIKKYEENKVDFLPQSQYNRMKKINEPAVLHVLNENSIEEVKKNKLGFYVFDNE